MKRHIAIPLLCVVLVAALSISVFAAPHDSPSFPYPENDVSGSVSISVSFNSFYHTQYVLNESLSFGSLWTGLFKDPTSPSDNFIMDGYADFRFNLSVYVGGSFYIAIPSTVSNNGNYGFGSLSSYLDNSNSYDVNFGSNWPVNIYTPSGSTFSKSSGNASLSVRFVCFDNVPPGVYTVGYSLLSSNELICFGVYASQGEAYGAIVDQFVNGSVSYTEAVDQLFEFQESLNPVDNHEAMVQALELQNNLAKLNNAASTVAAAKSNQLDGKMESVINSFASGDVTLKNAMDSIQTDFSDALSGAQTVEEAQAVTAVYQANLKQLELQSQFQLMEGLDGVLTDEEVQKSDDYYAAEKELINAFDVAEFDAQLQFDNWFLLLPQKEAFDYKRFFDYLLNDSEIRHFIIIPLTLGLVSIIMGTRMRVRPSSGGKGDDD